MSYILSMPASHDDCLLREEHLFIEARELLARLYELEHALITLEKQWPWLKKHRERTERLVTMASHRTARRKMEMTRARMESGVHVFKEDTP